MHVETFTFNPFQENTYLIYDDTKQGAIVDPGCYNLQEQEELKSFIKREGIKLVHLLNTHAHIDHVFGNQFIHKEYKLDLALHPLDLPCLHMAVRSAQVYGLNYTESPLPKYDLNEGEKVEFGQTTLEILHVPGHAPGHVVFFNRKENIIIGGDVLFRGSIGRTDLPGGNHQQLLDAIEAKLFVLDQEVVIYPGHGPITNIGFERENNPFFTAD